MVCSSVGRTSIIEQAVGKGESMEPVGHKDGTERIEAKWTNGYMYSIYEINNAEDGKGGGKA